jgi:saccharopine dehydrogenase (NADP+, L-glutamate forming)
VQQGYDLWLWNRSIDKAQAILDQLDGQCQARYLDWEALDKHIGPGDLVVSMLPGNFHVQVAELAIAKGAHFVSSSYLSPPMSALHDIAKAANLCVVNEVGLDPGIDHLMAHSLVESYRTSPAYAVANKIEFKSYCGGLPAQMNAFTYKFSWSPLGVLKALKSPAQWREFGTTQNSVKPWQSVRPYSARLSDGSTEDFTAYPNRDSLPFMQQYQFDNEWPVETFVRGTLRGNNWINAWQDIFALVDSLEGEPTEVVENKLSLLSDELWQNYAYDKGEADRVVLSVELAALDPDSDQKIWHQSYNLDAYGNQQGSAMARLVSITVSLAVEAVLAGNIAVGVSTGPQDVRLAEAWLAFLRQQGEPIVLTDYLAV